MSALLASVEFFSSLQHLCLSVSTFVPHNNNRHLKMKEDRGREGSGGEERKRGGWEETSEREERIHM